MNRKVSAPGKMVIAGEYAVLYGHEALSISVDRRVNVVVRPSKSFPQVPGIVECVLSEFRLRGVSVASFEAHIDSSAFHAVGREKGGIFFESTRYSKLGLGSSAAVAVALVRAVLDFNGHDNAETLSLAFAAHDRFTRGLGSGIDVATSYYGGAIRFQIREGIRTVTPCSLAIGSDNLVAVYTNSTQSTTSYLRRLTEASSSRKEEFEKAILGISRGAQTIVRCMTNAHASQDQWKELCEAVFEHNSATDQLGLAVGIDILSAPHRTIAQIARRHNGAAKPSGAGGGDLALCFVEKHRRDGLIKDLETNSFSVIDLHFCDAGVQ